MSDEEEEEEDEEFFWLVSRLRLLRWFGYQTCRCRRYIVIERSFEYWLGDL